MAFSTTTSDEEENVVWQKIVQFDQLFAELWRIHTSSPHRT